MKLWRHTIDKSGPTNDELKIEDYRIKVLSKRVVTRVISQDQLSSMSKSEQSDGQKGTTTDDQETEGRDTVTDFSTVEAFN